MVGTEGAVVGVAEAEAEEGVAVAEEVVAEMVLLRSRFFRHRS